MPAPSSLPVPIVTVTEWDLRAHFGPVVERLSFDLPGQTMYDLYPDVKYYGDLPLLLLQRMLSGGGGAGGAGGAYSFVWFIESDVRFTGDWRALLATAMMQPAADKHPRPQRLSPQQQPPPTPPNPPNGTASPVAQSPPLAQAPPRPPPKPLGSVAVDRNRPRPLPAFHTRSVEPLRVADTIGPDGLPIADTEPVRPLSDARLNAPSAMDRATGSAGEWRAVQDRMAVQATHAPYDPLGHGWCVADLLSLSPFDALTSQSFWLHAYAPRFEEALVALERLQAARRVQYARWGAAAVDGVVAAGGATTATTGRMGRRRAHVRCGSSSRRFATILCSALCRTRSSSAPEWSHPNWARSGPCTGSVRE
jgi:hypothetical protein